MWEVFGDIAGNLLFTFENIVLLLITIGGLIFYAKDFKLGVLMHFLSYGLTFIWFYYMGMNWGISLICCFICLVMLSFSLYAVSQTSRTGFT